MDYFKINYNKLQNIPQIKYFKIVILIIIISMILLYLARSIEIYQKFECMGIYSNNLLKIKINNELSDNFNKSEYITFNNKKTKFEIQSYGNYEIIDNNIFQEIDLILDKEFYDNEIGNVVFYYDKKSILRNVFDLFK